MPPQLSRIFSHTKKASKKLLVSACSLVVASALVLTGCMGGNDPTISDRKKTQVKVQLNKDNCDQDNAADAINMDDSIWDPTKYSSREEFIEATGPYLVQMCNACNFRYPSIVYAQMFWEGGVSYSNGTCSISNIGTQNHALFGIKAAGEDQSKWPYWDGGEGLGHADGGNARAYSCFSNSVYDYIDWLIRYKGNGTSTANGKTYDSYAAGANDASSGQEGLSILLMMGYCPTDYSKNAFGTASNLTKFDSQVSISGSPVPLSEANISSNTAKSPSSSVSNSTGELIGGDTAEQVWNFFKAEGFSDEATAGILGNMQAESGVDPTAIQGGGQGPAAGIVQWESWSGKSGRWKGMSDYAASKGKDWTDLQCQLEYILTGSGELPDSLKTYSYGNCGKHYEIDDFKNITDVDEAATVFEKCFERASAEVIEKRCSFAREFYERFKGTAATNATETMEECEDDDGNQRFGASGITNGEEYIQFQGSHYDGGAYDESKGIDSGAQRAACGATSFAQGVNMLLGEPHKFCGVEVWHEMGSDSTTIGWDGGRTKASDWLASKGLDKEITVTGINDISDRAGLEQKLKEGNVCVVSSQTQVFKNADGTFRYSGGHYILFYKYENGTFYANDCGSRAAGGGIAYTSTEVDNYFAAPGRYGGSCSIKRV